MIGRTANRARQQVCDALLEYTAGGKADRLQERDAVPLAMERRYDFPEFGDYLGNVGSHHQISPIKGQIVFYRSSLGRIRFEIPFVLRFPTTSGGRLENLG